MDIKKLEQWLGSREYDRRLTERLEILQKSTENAYERNKVLLQCADSPVFFLNHFGWIQEPRYAKQPDIEMFLFPHQEEFLLDMIQAEEGGEDRLYEKSRDMGFSWTVVGYYLWRWLFTNGWIGLYGSRKQDEVDNRTLSSFYGKLRYMNDRLPGFFIPDGFKKKLHDTENRLINPAMNSLILGESANPQFGRARRSSIAVLDEIFYQEYGQDAWRALAETCRSRIAISTARRTRFARTLREGMESNKWLRSAHWSQHPFKDKEWYEATKKRYAGDELGLKAELEMEYTEDPEILVYPSAELIKLENIEYDPNVPVMVSNDWGIAPSQTVILWWQRQEGRWVLLEGMIATEKPLAWYLPFLDPNIDTPKDLVYNETEKAVLEKVRTWRRPLMYYGEAAHYQRAGSLATSIANELAKYNIRIVYNSMAIAHEKRQVATKQMIASGVVFNDTHYVRKTLDALTMARFPATKGIKEKVAPIHDETADCRAAVENFAVNVQNTGKVKSFAYDKRYA